MVGSGSDELLDPFPPHAQSRGSSHNLPPTFGMYEAIVKLNRGILSQFLGYPTSLDMAGIQKHLLKSKSNRSLYSKQSHRDHHLVKGDLGVTANQQGCHY